MRERILMDKFKNFAVGVDLDFLFAKSEQTSEFS